MVIYSDGVMLLCMLGCLLYDMLIFDWYMLGMFGIDVLSVVCSCYREVLLILFVMVEEGEKSFVCVFMYGVDDYIVKLFCIVELCVCVDVLLCCVYLILYGCLLFVVGLYYFNL